MNRADKFLAFSAFFWIMPFRKNGLMQQLLLFQRGKILLLLIAIFRKNTLGNNFSIINISRRHSLH